MHLNWVLVAVPTRVLRASHICSASALPGTAARKGGRAFVPELQRIAAVRMVSYKEAVKQFVEGYREGQKLSKDADAAEHAATSVSTPTKASPSADPKVTSSV